MMQQGDVSLYQTNDDGDITVEGGVVAMTGGLETAAYTSLFGGNEEDDGLKGNPLQYWGNLIETEPAAKYRSEVQHLLEALPSTSGNLRRLEEAARRDLKWFKDTGVANTIRVEAIIPKVNSVQFYVIIEANGKEYEFKFVENWKASA